MRTNCRTVEWQSAIRRRTPGSWERTRVSEPTSASPQTLPSRRSGGFFISPASSRSKNFRLGRKRETRISGRESTRPKRGARRRERRASTSRGPPMAGRTKYGFARRCEIHPERRDTICFAICLAACGGFVFQVVKSIGYIVKDLHHLGEPARSFPWKFLAALRGSLCSGGEDVGYFGLDASGFDPRRLRHVPWNPLRKAGVSRDSVFFSRKPALPRASNPISIVPQNAFQNAGGEETCYFATHRVAGSSPAGRTQVRP
jgi:hypothetical protein